MNMGNFLKKIFGGNGPDARLKGKTVLVVDDGEVERKFLSGILSKQGCRVLTASEGEAGIRLAYAENPDLILLDFIMPGMNGNEVLQRLRDGEKTKNIPVVFLTGSDTPSHIVSCYDLGAECFLTKPISAGALVNQLALTLQEPKPESTP